MSPACRSSTTRCWATSALRSCCSARTPGWPARSSRPSASCNTSWFPSTRPPPLLPETFPMKFAAIIEYSQDKAKVAAVRPVHRQYLLGLRDKGQIAATGPFTDESGALIIYEAATREEAESLLQGDPFHAQGIFL